MHATTAMGHHKDNVRARCRPYRNRAAAPATAPITTLRSIGLTIIEPLEPEDCDEESPLVPLPLPPLLLLLLAVLAAPEPLALAVETGVTFAERDSISHSHVHITSINIPSGRGWLALSFVSM